MKQLDLFDVQLAPAGIAGNLKNHKMTRKGYTLDPMRSKIQNAKWRLFVAGLALCGFAFLTFLLYN